jgi:hypothetical protein
VVYQLKTPYRDGTTHFVFAPIEFLARLAALVPRPRGNLVRYHGILAPTPNIAVPWCRTRRSRNGGAARVRTHRCRRWGEIVRTILLHRLHR